MIKRKRNAQLDTEGFDSDCEPGKAISVLTWVKTFLNSPLSFRRATKERVIKQLEIAGTGNSKDINERQTQGKIIKQLVSNPKMELVGVLESISYLKVEGDAKEELPFIWEHKTGGPSLLYYDKKTGVLLIVAPGIAFNDSVVNRYDENRKQHQRGVAF